MKQLMRAGVRSIAIVACALAFSLGAFVAPAYADGATVTKITNKETGATYENLATATADAKSGETILLPEGNYTLYKVSSRAPPRARTSPSWARARTRPHGTSVQRFPTPIILAPSTTATTPSTVPVPLPSRK